MAVIKQIKDSNDIIHDIIDTKDTAGIKPSTKTLYLIGTTTYNGSDTNPTSITNTCGDSVYVNPNTRSLNAEILNADTINTGQFATREISTHKITLGTDFILSGVPTPSMSLGDNFSVTKDATSGVTSMDLGDFNVDSSGAVSAGAVSAESININNSLNVGEFKVEKNSTTGEPSMSLGSHFRVELSGAVTAGSIVCENNATVSGNIVVGSGTGSTISAPTSGVIKCNALTCFAAGSSTDSSIIINGFDGTITADGDIHGKGFYQTSDERLKTFTEEYDINLDDIKNIKTGRFYWNSDDNRVINGGVTAQSVEKYFPELVKEDDNGTKTVNYDGLAVVAIAAIKKLTERIEELENIVYNK